jgi:hypothetical protein
LVGLGTANAGVSEAGTRHDWRQNLTGKKKVLHGLSGSNPEKGKR